MHLPYSYILGINFHKVCEFLIIIFCSLAFVETCNGLDWTEIHYAWT